MVEDTDIIITIKYRQINWTGHLKREYDNLIRDVTNWILGSKITIGSLRQELV